MLQLISPTYWAKNVLFFFSKRKFQLLPIVALLFIAISNLQAQSTSTNRLNLLILGDSIAAGFGVESEEAFPALIQQKINSAKLNVKVLNGGVSGDTSAGGLRRIDWYLNQRVDFLLLELGGNDGLRGLSPESTRSNLLKIIEKVRSKNPTAKTIVAGMQMPPNMGEEYLGKFSKVFPDVAQQSKSALLPFLLEGVGGKAELNLPDRIHPTAEGHQIVANHLWKTMGPILGVSDKP